MSQHNFADKLAFSLGDSADIDIRILEAMVEGAKSIKRTDADKDRLGADYIVTLRGGGEILVDAKTREAGCKRFWIDGPELALEIWSVMPLNGPGSGKVGWTLNERSEVDMILFKFDSGDSEDVFLYPFHALRTAFRRNLAAWRKRYGTQEQDSGKWKSQCIFVPEWVVWRAVGETRIGQVIDTKELVY